MLENKIKIIAEAGVNHNGSLMIAKQLVKKAKIAGADIVKFQTFDPEKIVTQNAKLANYQKINSNNKKQINLLNDLHLSNSKHLQIKSYCDKIGIEFLSTPFDVDSLKFLISIGIKRIKIPSGEITNYLLLDYISKLNLPIILSTGMSNNREITEALKILTKRKINKKNITILHCNSSYPTPMKDVNLRAIQTIQLQHKTQVGLSDHTNGTEIPIAAAAIGAKILEKHFTLDRKLKGPDHKSSLEPIELSYMIRCVRNIEIAIGNGIKKPSNSEKPNKKIVRKSLVALKKIKKGEIFTYENITAKRPGTGISPMLIGKIIGRKAKKIYNKDDFIKN